MEQNNNRLAILEQKFKILEQRHQKLGYDLNLIEQEIEGIKSVDTDEKPSETSQTESGQLNKEVESSAELPANQIQQERDIVPLKTSIGSAEEFYNKRKAAKPSINWEKLIGENIINKVGIIITVVGIGIGANYVIENDLISPLTRILIGFLFSFAMAGVAFKLRTKYLNYSSVLLGGALASMYLLTYAAYDFYELIPQFTAFLVLIILTMVTVVTAIGYNKQWISVFGLVGGYAVPFLLGDETGSTAVLFSYVLFLNLGVLIVSLYKYWRLLFLSAFGFTWVIFLFWFSSVDPALRDVNLSFFFSTAFFMLFYAAFLISKVRYKNELIGIDISTLLLNTFLYFGIGYATLNVGLEKYHGAFTVLLAIVHLFVGQVIQRYELPTKTTHSFINGIFLVFITLAIPIQFTEKWITIAWSLEALLLLWMGRTKKLVVYEILSYPTIFLASLSLLYYWVWFYLERSSAATYPFINQMFLTSLVFLLAFAAILFLLKSEKERSSLQENNFVLSIVNTIVPLFLITGTYLVLFFELSRVFEFWEFNSLIIESSGYNNFNVYNPSIYLFKILAQISYSIVFLHLGFKINKKWFEVESLYRIGFFFSIVAMLFFFMAFFGAVQDLRHYYLGINDASPHNQSIANILMRYIFIGFGFLNIKTLTDLLPYQKSSIRFTGRFELFLFFTLLFILSSELIQWLDIFGFENSYKLGLSILWGLFSLALVLYGILKSNQQLRVASLALFAVTLVKLFFYDISHLSTISKTVVFMSLGILLLAISFLYNRYREKLVEKA